MKCQKCQNLEKFFENPNIPFEQKLEIAMQFEQLEKFYGFCPDCENLDNFVDDDYFENN